MHVYLAMPLSVSYRKFGPCEALAVLDLIITSYSHNLEITDDN